MESPVPGKVFFQIFVVLPSGRELGQWRDLFLTSPRSPGDLERNWFQTLTAVTQCSSQKEKLSEEEIFPNGKNSFPSEF